MGDILSFRLNARTKRSHYWAGLILLTVATTLLQNVSDGLYWVQMTENAWNLSQVLIILATLVVFCFGVALIVRRLHDIGRKRSLGDSAPHRAGSGADRDSDSRLPCG